MALGGGGIWLSSVIDEIGRLIQCQCVSVGVMGGPSNERLVGMVADIVQ